MSQIKDKKRWWAVTCCKQTVGAQDLPIFPGMLFGIGVVFALFALMTLIVAMPVHASAANHPITIVPVAGLLKDLVEKRGLYKAKSEVIDALFAEAKTDGKDLDFSKIKSLGENLTTIQKGEKIITLNEELKAIGAELDILTRAEQAEADSRTRANGGTVHKDFVHPNGENDRNERKQTKSFGQKFVESDAYKNRNSRAIAEVDVERKTLFERTNGWAPESTRSGLVVPYAVRPIQIIDLIPSISVTTDAYKYMEETTLTEAAVEKAEGAAFGEAEFELTQRTVVIEKVPVWIPVTDEQLEDVQGIQGYLDNRLQAMIMRRVDYQSINGNGSTPNVKGILNVGGSLQTQAKGSDDVPTAIRKAMTKVRVGGRAVPSAVVLHSNDWQDIRTLKTTDGIFIWGPPSEVGPERIWGRPIAENDVIAENTGLVGDFQNYSYLIERSGMDVQVGYVNDDFVKGKKAVRASVRLAFVWLRPAAFCTVTSI